MAAQGLATHTISDGMTIMMLSLHNYMKFLLDPNLYVSVDLGAIKKKTKTYKSFINPTWNEEFKL